MLLRDILGRRRPAGFCEKILSHKVLNPVSDMIAPQPTPTAYRGVYITLHYITLHYITLHYITLHYITLHYITLRC
jgi:hypothetical protein